MEDLLPDDFAVVCARLVSVVSVDDLSLECSSGSWERRLLSGLPFVAPVEYLAVRFGSVPAGFIELPLACLSAASG